MYDALYGTDVIAEDGGAERGIGYNPRRGARVIEFARRFLDESFPLDEGSHREAIEYRMAERGLEVKLRSGAVAALAVPEALAGFRGEPASPSAILLKHHGLHVEIQVDRHHLIGADDPAGVSNILRVFTEICQK